MIPGLLGLVVLEELLHLLLELVLLLIEVLHDRIVLLLLVVVYGLQVCELLAEPPQLLDLGGQLLLLVLDLVLDLDHHLRDLLQRLLLLVVQYLIRLSHPLQLILHVRVSGDTLLLLEVSHELLEVLSATLEDLLGPREHRDLSLDLSQHLLHVLILRILPSQVRRVLLKVVPLHVLAAPRPRILSLLIVHELLERELLSLQLLDLLDLRLLLLADRRRLTLVYRELIVRRRVLPYLLLQRLALPLQLLHIRREPLELALRRHRLLQHHLDPLQALLFVLELAAEDVVAELAVPARLVPEVVEHAVGGDVVRVHLADVHEALLDGEELRLVELDHVGELALLLGELGVLLLLLAELGCGLEERLEVLLVGLRLKQVDLSQ